MLHFNNSYFLFRFIESNTGTSVRETPVIQWKMVGDHKCQSTFCSIHDINIVSKAVSAFVGYWWSKNLFQTSKRH